MDNNNNNALTHGGAWRKEDQKQPCGLLIVFVLSLVVLMDEYVGRDTSRHPYTPQPHECLLPKEDLFFRDTKQPRYQMDQCYLTMLVLSDGGGRVGFFFIVVVDDNDDDDGDDDAVILL